MKEGRGRRRYEKVGEIWIIVSSVVRRVYGGVVGGKSRWWR